MWQEWSLGVTISKIRQVYPDTILIDSLILQTLAEGPPVADAGWESPRSGLEVRRPALSHGSHKEQNLHGTLGKKKPICISV